MDDGKKFPEAPLSIDAPFARPPLRFRRLGGGYRREDVEHLLAEMRLTFRELELELATIHARARDLESQLGEARLELDLFRERRFELARAMTNARVRAEKIEHDAQMHAAEIVAAAGEEAGRRLEELGTHVAARCGELEELLALTKQTFVAGVRGCVRELEVALERAGTDGGETPPMLPGLEEHAGTDRGQTPPAPAEPTPEPEPDREPDPPSDDTLFTDHVELDAGPFPDIDSLSAFESELTRLPDIDDVHVRRLDGGRAVIELTLTSSAPLVAVLREHLSYSLWIRGRNGTRLVIDVEAAPGAV